MAKTIIWTKKALGKLDEILGYLENESSEESASRFFQIVLDKLEVLSRYPEIGRKSKKKKTIRFQKIDKNRNVYYRIEGKKLIVIYFFDTRQHPDRNPF